MGLRIERVSFRERWRDVYETKQSILVLDSKGVRVGMYARLSHLIHTSCLDVRSGSRKLLSRAWSGREGERILARSEFSIVENVRFASHNHFKTKHQYTFERRYEETDQFEAKEKVRVL